MAAFFLLIGILAAAAWFVALASFVTLVGLAPRGARFSTINDLGWWRFSEIEHRIGQEARGPIARYRKAFLIFFLCVLAGIASSFIALDSNTAASG